MNKLEERFEEVIWESNPNASMMGDLSSNYLVSGFAKEAKDIAIEFVKYCNKWKNVVGNSSIPLNVEEEYGTLDNYIYKELFYNFINQRYEK